MGYVGGKIPGHTGATQKNKKAFARRKQWSKGRSNNNAPKTGRSDLKGRYASHYRTGGWSSGVAYVLTALIFSGACYMGYSIITASEPTVFRAHVDKGEGFSDEQIFNYNFLIKSAQRNLVRNDYRVAVYEFNEALKIARYGKEARLGLLETLKAQCVELGEYCDMVEPQRDFVERMGWFGEDL